MSEAEARRLFSCAPHNQLVETLRVVTKAFSPSRWLTVHEAAELAGMSVRSLQRELASNGVAFSTVVDQVRCELALEMLKDKEVSSYTIALALGYSTTTNFARAFRRWTGITLTMFRETNV